LVGAAYYSRFVLRNFLLQLAGFQSRGEGEDFTVAF
jgi:hypothetical protein